MIEKDMIWHNDHHQQAIRDLMILQKQLFNQRIERKKYYKKNPNNKNDMEQEKMMIGKTLVNVERYHVMSEKEIFEKLNRENPSRNVCTSDHAMMAWEYLEEPINKTKVILKSIIHQIRKKIHKRIQQKKKKPTVNSQNHLLQQIMIV